MKVIKRDGKVENFDVNKIINAVDNAWLSVHDELSEEFDESLMTYFLEYNFNMDEIPVDNIHKAVELFLWKQDRKVRKAYIDKRKERDEIRADNLPIFKEIDEKLEAANIQNQNANLDEASFGGRMGEAGRVVTKRSALRKSMRKAARDAHNKNERYTHDLDSYAVGMHNCLSIPFDKLLAEGFNTRQTDVRPASSINTAFQLVAVIFQLQSLQQFGGVAATHLDWSMVPYVRYSFLKHYNEICDTIPFCSKLTLDRTKEETRNTSINDSIYKGKHWYNFMRRYIQKVAIRRTNRETYQAVEGMYHNLNTLQSRSGNQLPFTSINYGTCVFDEGRMVINALLNVCIKGLGKYHRTSIFPCGIWQWKKGVNAYPGDPNYDLYLKALKSTAKRIYPNYANCDWSVQKKAERASGFDFDEYFKDIYNKPIDDILQKMSCIMSTMGCRTYNGFDINGLGAQKDGRGNICPQTIILPTLAMQSVEECNGKVGTLSDEVLSTFYKKLEYHIDESRIDLKERFEHICSQPDKAATFMYENDTMVGYVPEEGIRSALKHGTLAIGQLGLAETLQILCGHDHSEDESAMIIAENIEKIFNKKCAQFKEEDKLNFGVYYTPAENLCYTAMKKFKETYGEIPNVSDKEFFTNSMHVPVWKEVDPFQKIDIESRLTGYSNAGCITYIELPSTAINNVPALYTFNTYAMEHDIPYFAMNFPLDFCNHCHAQGDFNGVCPECGSTDIDELRRVTGYISTTKKHFNLGKIAEELLRFKHIRN